MRTSDLRTKGGFGQRRLVLLMCTCLVALGFGCTAVHPGLDARHAHPGRIDFNLSEDPHSLNPIFALSDDEREISHLMFDMLLDVDSRGELVPDLALAVPSKANHEISADGRTIVYRLRHDVRWQDGQPLTASDVVYTWHAITDPDNNVAGTKGYDLVDLIFAPDPYTVVVRLKHPWAPAVATLFTYGTNPMAILPAHILQDQEDLRRSDFNLHPVGSGPYRLVRWTRDQELVFAASHGYFRGEPKVSTVVAHIVPNTNTTLTMLRSGELDWALQSPAQRLALLGDPGIRMHYVAYSGVGMLAFNCRRPPFSDARMRRAVAMSIDRRRLSAAVTAGQYPVAQSDQPPFSWAHDPSARLPAFDAARADSLFDALGWRRGADGLRRKNGRILSMTITTFPEGDTAVRSAEYVQEMLRDRGIDAGVKKVTVAQFYLPASEHGLLLSGTYDLAYVVWRAGLDPDDSDLVTCRGAANYAGMCDGRLDGLERRALTAADVPTRRALYFAIQERLAELVPYDFLYAPTYGYAVRRDIRGFSPSPYSPTWNAYAWSKD